MITLHKVFGRELLILSCIGASLYCGTGCRTPTPHKGAASGKANTSATTVVANASQSSPAPVAKVVAPAEPAHATASVATKPGFFSRLFGANASSSSGQSVSSKTVEPDKAFTPYRIQVNETVMISLRGITPEQPNIELVVDENGEIKLPYINSIKAEGKTTSELENYIRDAYLTQQIYKHLTVNVIIPSQTAPTFYVKGEVRSPGRLPYVNGMTMLSAVAAAGGPTDYASSDMTLVRGSKKIKFNYYDLEKHPDRDQPIQAGDIIIIDKSWF